MNKIIELKKEEISLVSGGEFLAAATENARWVGGKVSEGVSVAYYGLCSILETITSSVLFNQFATLTKTANDFASLGEKLYKDDNGNVTRKKSILTWWH